MIKLLLVLILLLGISHAEEPSPAKLKKLILKGEKIAKHFCVDANLSMEGNSTTILAQLIEQKPCGVLSTKHQKALAYYLAYRGDLPQKANHIHVPNDAKCPVCGMFVYKYPKWSTLMVIKGEFHYFDGVKDMMKYYIFDADFPYDRADIDKLEVSDFYTLKAIPAKEAYYVIGSNVFGPMGDELIPFETQKEAKSFMEDHKGIRMVRFEDIDAKMVMRLDGL